MHYCNNTERRWVWQQSIMQDTNHYNFYDFIQNIKSSYPYKISSLVSLQTVWCSVIQSECVAHETKCVNTGNDENI